MQCGFTMDDILLSALGTQYPSRTSNVSDKPRRRKKARRSCLNCQRAHRTCGNERPCPQCINRGMNQTCVDGNRKPPKYLWDLPPKPIAPGLHRTMDSPRVIKYSEGTIGDISHGHEDTLGQGLVEFIDPNLLHVMSPSAGLDDESSLHMHDNSDCLGPCATSKFSPGKDTCPSEQQDIPGDMWAELFAMDSSYDHENQSKQRSYGFAISNGWSSTFFPS